MQNSPLRRSTRNRSADRQSATPRSDQNDRRNRFASHPRFAKQLQVCDPVSGEILLEADQQISHVYFPVLSKEMARLLQ